MPNCDYIELSGTVGNIVYRNEENGYTVLKINTVQANAVGEMGKSGTSKGIDAASGASVTVVGSLPFVNPGEMITVRGLWVMHQSYGSQFQAHMVEYQMPKTDAEIYSFLASGAIKGIGASMAKMIVERFGEDTLRVLDEEPDKLASLKGISEAKAKEIGSLYKKQTALRRLTEFFTASELSLRFALRAYQQFGEDAQAALTDNPYLITDAEYGASFGEADTFALRIGFERDSPERVQAAVLYELRHNADNGHTFIPDRKLITATSGLIKVDGSNVAEAIEELIASGDMMLEEIAGERACYLRNLYSAELFVATRLAEMSKIVKVASYNPEQIWQELSIELSSAQKDAVRKAAEHGAFVLTGGPGTGKTTTVNAILTLFERMGLKTALAAPTGRAAKRMTELCGREARTIHRLLEVKFDEGRGGLYFAHDEQHPLAADAVIVDETSMIDIELMEALLLALKPDSRLIMVGDADQLPSVGPGNLLSDILRSEVMPAVRLTEVFRQAAESLIIRNAHLINGGNAPEQGRKTDDFFVLTAPDGEATAKLVEELCFERLPNKMGIPASQVQVLTPTRINGTGTNALNKRLQAVINPAASSKAEKLFGDFTFREGDRVMQVHNNYELLWQKEDGEIGMGVFNGDVGSVAKIDTKEQTLTVDFDDRSAAYAFEMLNELEPAYAMTVHKSQGSEYRAVILALMNVPPSLLTRSLLYTAVTRARELLIITGDQALVHQMVANDRPRKRYSGLRVRLVTASAVGGDVAPPSAVNQ
jgi:exodeoxyribonuclease V alpha subunit